MLVKRLDEITKLLEANGSVEVADLSTRLKVTEKTVRQDLIKLENMQIATRVHGGAILKNVETDIYPVPARKQRNLKEKERIARAAYDMIEEGDVIILDAGSTTLQLARMLDKSVIVVTNDPFIAHALLENEKITLYVTGGLLLRQRGSYSYTGADAVRTIRAYHANKCFIGASAVNFENGLMVFSTSEAEVKKAMVNCADEVICLADYSKYHKTAFSSFAPLSVVQHAIVDDSIPEEDVAALRKLSIEVTVV